MKISAPYQILIVLDDHVLPAHREFEGVIQIKTSREQGRESNGGTGMAEHKGRAIASFLEQALII